MAILRLVLPRVLAIAVGVGLVVGCIYVLREAGKATAAVDGLMASLGGSGQATSQSGAAPGRLTIWARLPIQAPECNCHTPPLAQVYSTLTDEHLEDGLTDEGSVGSWQYMSFTFDPRQVSRQHIGNLIATNGGVILPDRPATLPTATVLDHA